MATNISSIGNGGPARDYTTMQAWETAVAGNLVTAGDIEKGECYDDSDFGEHLDINGSTTGPSNYMWLTAASGEGHNGTDANGVVNDLTTSTAQTYGIKSRDPYTLIENIIILNGGGTAMDHITTGTGGNNSTFRNIISRDCPDIAFNVAGDATVTGVIFINCIGIDSVDRTFNINDNPTASAYGCLSWNSGNDGFEATGTWTAIVDCISMGSSNQDYGGGTANESYNISSDATAAGTGSLINRTATASASPGAGDWVIFTNITSTTEDFGLQDNLTDNDAQEAGTDVSGTTGYSLDIELEDRNGGTVVEWDIGPDQIIPAGVGVVVGKLINGGLVISGLIGGRLT